jgi:hypothetical protein
MTLVAFETFAEVSHEQGLEEQGLQENSTTASGL